MTDATTASSGAVVVPVSVKPVPPSWVEANQGLAVSIGFVLIACYVAPVYLVGGAFLESSGFQDAHNLALSWFAAFLASADSTLNQFHKVLLPLITAVSAAAFRTRPTRGMLILGAFILVSFTVTVSVGVIFDMQDIVVRLKGTDSPPDLKLAKALFARIQESLMMYFMMLLGIGVANSSR